SITSTTSPTSSMSTSAATTVVTPTSSSTSTSSTTSPTSSTTSTTSTSTEEPSSTTTVAPCVFPYELVENVGCADISSSKKDYTSAQQLCKAYGAELAAPNNVADLKDYITTKYNTG
ncbi:unnamed protein product, partial [Meganyctiphanes norvegica]